MANKRVAPSEFADTLNRLLKEYGEEAFDIAEEAAKKTARDAVSELKSTSPTGATGDYRSGWSHKGKKGGLSYNETVYNRKKPQLTHLINDSHPTGLKGVNRGYYEGNDHITRAEEKYNREFFNEVKSKL